MYQDVTANFQQRIHVVLIIVLVAKSVYLVVPSVGFVMETIAPAFQNLKLWTIQRRKILKGMPSNYLIFDDMRVNINYRSTSNILLIYKRSVQYTLYDI